MKPELVAQYDSRSPVSETFKNLRTNIQFMNSNKKMKTILVTSTVSGEGKTWVSANLAITFAQTGKKVILVDSDMRKGKLYNIFDTVKEGGLSNYLSGLNESGNEPLIEDDIDNINKYIRETNIKCLSLMTSGNYPPNPSELLEKNKMKELIDKLNEMFDIVIFDGTPSKLVTDAVVLSRIVDTTIVVVSYNLTKKNDLQDIVKNIKNVGGNVSGIVYNRAPVVRKEYYRKLYYSDKNVKDKRK